MRVGARWNYPGRRGAHGKPGSGEDPAGASPLLLPGGNAWSVGRREVVYRGYGLRQALIEDANQSAHRLAL
jgi:hypothetical protein